VTAARLAARCVELLGPVEGPVAVVAPPPLVEALAARVPIANGDQAATGAVCVFLDGPIDPSLRVATLDALAGRLPATAPLVVVDHNQPRQVLRRMVAAVSLALHGQGPARARYPVAREVQDRGFMVERLCFDPGERVQLVLARRRPHL
jgi:hypothetical protein